VGETKSLRQKLALRAELAENAKLAKKSLCQKENSLHPVILSAQNCVSQCSFVLTCARESGYSWLYLSVFICEICGQKFVSTGPELVERISLIPTNLCIKTPVLAYSISIYAYTYTLCSQSSRPQNFSRLSSIQNPPSRYFRFSLKNTPFLV
jgi:hypothetical protein